MKFFPNGCDSISERLGVILYGMAIAGGALFILVFAISVLLVAIGVTK